MKSLSRNLMWLKFTSASGVLNNGFRIVIITGKDGGQEVLHLHIIGGGYIPHMIRRN